MRRFLLALPALLILAGCKQPEGNYPSLLLRPIEQRDNAEPVRLAPVAPPDAALDARIAALGAALGKSANDFAATSQQTEAKVATAAGTAPGSEGWLDAEAALAALGAARGTTLGAQADLERLAIDRGTSGMPPYPALDAAIAAARKQADDQSARVAMLENALAGR